ncbi:MAG TPA: glycine oxidase ThiO [Conexibacter sp.]|jgi:glycine oxidase|nr:glycine oxidase ThiO [Conexibacter sp.]
MPHQSDRSFDVAIVGGGIAGLAVAWRAQRRGLRTVVLERDRLAHGATHVAAGMLAPISEARSGERSLLALSRASLDCYPSFVAELTQASGRDPGFTACGTLAVARDRDEAEALERELAEREALGLPVERLLASEARRREPALSPTLRLALDVPGDHAIDPRALAAALAVAVERAGGVLREGAEVVRVLVAPDGERVEGLELRTSGDGDASRAPVGAGERIAADQVVIAAGAWAGALDGLPEQARIPIRPVKGQIMRLRDPAGPGLLTRVIRMQPGYLVARGDGRYVLGATMEEQGFDTAATAGGIFELLRDAIELVPGVSELAIEEVAAGLRPGTPDNAPVLGRGAIEGLQWAAGCFRHGILLAPLVADVLAATLAGEQPPAVAAPFRATRFAPAREHAGASS